ncbi:hypothetical protein [Sphingomonas koreensis]|uniref:hypothetical protein n=1 Tax=Sphingomonas koreensis TaxID=93064 RepID=UPI000F7DF662|nr:hypothetical protein [Sphingomonas koreensis]MDC7808806.1 hypothetical protein [Sphingomonas koreensis]RSU98945.1 hypothetical protein CA256_03175 [Sphingomonas koreensis]
MTASRVSNSEEWRQRAVAVRSQFEGSGTIISVWARERGFDPKLVIAILRGDRPCRSGQSHKIAVALGLKREAAPPAKMDQAA